VKCPSTALPSRSLTAPWTTPRVHADVPRAPLLYLHGEDDGCLKVALAPRVAPLLGPGSRVDVIPGAGHFLHLERPGEVNRRIAEFIG
jgi:pimeloyl-ACP methyl ester carboxylesterase